MKKSLQFFYRFFSSPDLSEQGERVDIHFFKNPDFNTMDIYQKTHWRRYQFCTELIKPSDVLGDFACGTGYGSILIAQKAQWVLAADIREKVIKTIQKRYKNQKNVLFTRQDILTLNYSLYFDKIVSFETLEHFEEEKIVDLLRLFYQALKPKGLLIFSTPYLQEASPKALEMGFHKTFEIDELKIKNWLEQTGFRLLYFKYQNYQIFDLVNELDYKDFIIGVASKI